MSQFISNTALSRLLLLLVVAAGVFFFISFLVPVLAALIICFASWPIFQRLKKRCNSNATIASSVALLAIILGLIAPLFVVISYTLEEVRIFIAWLIEANENGTEVPVWISSMPWVGRVLEAQWAIYLSEPHQLGQLFNLVSDQQLGGISRCCSALAGLPRACC